jgi:DUF1365 family protein
MNPQVQPLIGIGQVRHVRLQPVCHAFSYEGYFWLLPMRALGRMGDVCDAAAVSRNRRGWLSFHDKDHGDGRGDALAWLDELLAEAGLNVHALQQGEVWLQTFPRVLGVVFKPVSFWWIHGADKALVAVVAEVNNTFGERHAYVLPVTGMGCEVLASKVFHVSPFCQTRGQYRFRFMRTGTWGVPGGGQERLVVRIDHDDEHGAVLQTSQSGVLAPLTAQSAQRVFWTHPLMTWGVLWRIHWQALLLWLRGVPVVKKPMPRPTKWSR